MKNRNSFKLVVFNVCLTLILIILPIIPYFHEIAKNTVTYIVEPACELCGILQSKFNQCKNNLKGNAWKFVGRNLNFSISTFISCIIIMRIFQVTGKMQHQPFYELLFTSAIVTFFILGVLTIAQGLIYSFIWASPRESKKSNSETIWNFSKRLNANAYDIVKEIMGSAVLFGTTIIVCAILYIFTRHINFLRIIKYLSMIAPTIVGVPVMFKSLYYGIGLADAGEEEGIFEIEGINANSGG